MIRGVNQSMVNRSIAGGGVACKCINGNGISGGSNESGVNSGKITAEFTVYSVAGINYMTTEDAFKINECLYNIYPTKYIINRYEWHTVSSVSNHLHRDTVFQSIDSNESTSIYSITLSFGMETSPLLTIQTSYINGKVSDDIQDMTIGTCDGREVEFIDRNDPRLEGADGIKTSMTLYYMER